MYKQMGAGWTTNGQSPDSTRCVPPSALSVVVDLHLWRQRAIIPNGMIDEGSVVSFGIVDVGLKFRYNLDRLYFSFQGGVGSGISLAPVSLHYGTAIEYMLNRNLSIALSQKRYWFPDLDHFLFVGIVTRLP